MIHVMRTKVNMVVNYGAELDPPSDDEGYNSNNNEVLTRVSGPEIEVHDLDSEPKNYEVVDENKTDVSIWSAVQDQAMEKRHTRQAKQAMKLMKVSGKEAVKNGVGIGAVINLYVDYRTYCQFAAPP